MRGPAYAAQVDRGENRGRPCASVPQHFVAKIRVEYLIPMRDMIKTASMQAGSEIVLRGKKFRKGTGVQSQQLRDFADGVEVPDNRLGYSTSLW